MTNQIHYNTEQFHQGHSTQFTSLSVYIQGQFIKHIKPKGTKFAYIFLG